jgi:2-succinyl-5-enolpyruvyl-6-hydroxy-3-cyclohexene-1-carboxylate synthase
VSRLLAEDVPQLLLDADGAWADPDRRVAELVVADVGDTCRRLTAQVAGPADDGWLTSWTDAERRARDALDAALDAHEQPTEPRIARDLVTHLPEGATLVAASSMPIRDLDRHARPRSGVRVLANRGASGIDGFVSTVLGVALVEPGPVVALAGDLSLLHDANGFLLSPDAEGVDATFVVVDNDGGGIFHFLPQAGFPASFERVFGTPHGRDLADLARLHHLGYRAVERAEDLPVALTEAIESGGIRLVHLRTDRHANVEVQRELTASVHRALDEA